MALFHIRGHFTSRALRSKQLTECPSSQLGGERVGIQIVLMPKISYYSWANHSARERETDKGRGRDTKKEREREANKGERCEEKKETERKREPKEREFES